MKHSPVVLVVGDAEEVEPIRTALECCGIFAVIACDVETAVDDGLASDLEIVCYSPSRFGRRELSSGRESEDVDPSGRITAIAQMARIARHPMPVIFVHENPTIWDVNYLRSCGAFYVLDRKMEETSYWQGLRDAVERALHTETSCAFCNRKVQNSGGYMRGAGQVAVCQECVLLCARDLLWSQGPGSQLTQ